MEGKKRQFIRQILFAIEIMLIAFFGLLLICNLIIILRSTLEPEKPPAVFGVMPMVVKSGSMSGDSTDHIEVDDLIFVTAVNYEKLEVGNIIAYESDDKNIITHRIVAIEHDNKGEVRFITKGDANNVSDDPIAKNKVIGIYRCRIPKIGSFITFLQTPLGIVLAVGIPIIIFFAYDFVYRRKQKKTAADKQG